MDIRAGADRRTAECMLSEPGVVSETSVRIQRLQSARLSAPARLCELALSIRVRTALQRLRILLSQQVIKPGTDSGRIPR